MGGKHYLHPRLVGFLPSRSAGAIHFGDRGGFISRGAPRLGGTKWHKSITRAILQNRVKSSYLYVFRVALAQTNKWAGGPWPDQVWCLD